MTPLEIKQTIIDRTSAYKPQVFSWPHDTFMHEPWGYAIHEASVRAWNDENRQTECVKFLQDWATEENIVAALEAFNRSYKQMIPNDRK